jgi:hypothetical protein
MPRLTYGTAILLYESLGLARHCPFYEALATP